MPQVVIEDDRKTTRTVTYTVHVSAMKTVRLIRKFENGELLTSDLCLGNGEHTHHLEPQFLAGYGEAFLAVERALTEEEDWGK